MKRVNAAEKRERRRQNTMTLLVGLIVLIVELAAAYVVLYQNEMLMGDAMSRTANAYYVIAIKPSKLASIGFVWNPLPSLLQLPILLFASLWKPLATVGFSGAIVTAIFAGMNAGLIFRYLWQSGLNVGTALLLTLLYAFNPFIFYYGFNGMSETIFFTAIIMITANLIFWAQDRQSGRLVVIALMLAMAFLTRYEAFPLAFSCGLALIVIVYLVEDKFSPFKEKPAKMKFDYLTASGTMMFLPMLYAIGIWIFLNWTIMGDPLYFLRSAYSNTSQSDLLWEGFLAAVNTPFKAFVFALKLMLPFLSLFIVILVERYFTKRLFRYDFLILILLIGGLTGFHCLMLLSGSSFGWLRFFSFSLPITIAWLPYELTQLGKRARNATLVASCIALVLSGAIVSYYMFNDLDLAREEYPVFAQHDMEGGTPEQIQMAEIINKKYSRATILMDSFVASTLILNLDHPENVITTTSDNFDEAVKHPLGQDVEYILLPASDGVGKLDALNNAYPGIYYEGAPWLELVEEVTGHRLYRILEDAYYDTIKEHGVLAPGKVELDIEGLYDN